MLVAARVVQATGAAFMLPTSLGLLLPEFPPEKRGAAVGIWAAVGGVAAAAGPPIGGLLVQAGWRWVFIVNVPIGIAAFVAASRLLREVRDDAGARPDALGAVLFTAAIAALTLGIVQGPTWGWSGGRVIGLFALAAVLLAAVAVALDAPSGAADRAGDRPHAGDRAGQPRRAPVLQRVRRASCSAACCS